MKPKEFSKSGWSELWASSNRHRIAISVQLEFISQSSGNTLVGCYISKVLNSIGINDQKVQLEISGGLSIWNWLTAVTCTVFIDKIGGRPWGPGEEFCQPADTSWRFHTVWIFDA